MYKNTDNTLRHGNSDPTGLKVANGLGWFSIALGALELLATRELTTALGMRGMVRWFSFTGCGRLPPASGFSCPKIQRRSFGDVSLGMPSISAPSPRT
jgi:hypothetical protein